MALKRAPTEKDVQLLLTFLVDHSENTAALAKRQLREILLHYPDCRRFLENPPEPQLAHETKIFLEETRLESLELRLRELSRKREQLDLEAGVCLLASLVYPSLTHQEIRKTLDLMAEQVKDSIEAEKPTPSHAVGLLRRYLFEELGFHGNQENYYDPDNSFINRVLDRRIGIPISLSCVYLFVAWRLDMAAYGIGLPGHFIVGHHLAGGAAYLDPFNSGRLLARHDCMELVHQRGIRFQESHLDPTPNHQILARIMVNLVNVYTEQGQSARAQWLTRLVPVVQGAA